ncbi:MAG: hypothetical protein AAGC57_13090 [Pseudomonadota bacterium]
MSQPLTDPAQISQKLADFQRKFEILEKTFETLVFDGGGDADDADGAPATDPQAILARMAEKLKRIETHIGPTGAGTGEIVPAPAPSGDDADGTVPAPLSPTMRARTREIEALRNRVETVMRRIEALEDSPVPMPIPTAQTV